MKTIFRFFSFILVLNAGEWITSQKANAQVVVNFQIFYNELSPYGTWVDNPDYGYVWVPNVTPGFTPYGTNGHWVFTDIGWTWVSDYPWGWAPFHYGRWYTDAIYGPMWVPGNEWGPGWVTWRRSRGYYGWAPIRPGVSISVAYGSRYHVPDNEWRFVRDRDLGRANINNYYVTSSNNVTIINNSTVINNNRVDKTRNVTYNAGPDRVEVEKNGGQKITPVAIKENNKPGQNLSKYQLQIYRPQFQNNNSAGPKPAPSKVGSLKDVKTPTQKTADTPPEKANQQGEQQPSQPQQTRQPGKGNHVQPQRIEQPIKQKHSQYRNNVPYQRSQQPQQTNPPQNKGEENRPH